MKSAFFFARYFTFYILVYSTLKLAGLVLYCSTRENYIFQERLKTVFDLFSMFSLEMWWGLLVRKRRTRSDPELLHFNHI
jgi:hypothetical protein